MKRPLLSRRSLEGYVEIDHRDSPGLPGLAARTGLPLGPGQRLQAPTATCSHCQAQVIMNPLRTRERAICSQCDKYVCDRCALNLHLTGVCYPWVKRMEDVLRITVNKGPNAPELSQLGKV